MKLKTASINLILCSILHGINHYLMIFYKPTYTVMTGYFGITNIGDITTRLTIFYVGYGLSNFLSGLLARKFSLKIILFWGTVLMSTSAMAVIFVRPDTYYLLVAFIFLMGLGGGVYHPVANTLITASYEGKPGHAIGMLSIGSAIGLASAPFAGEYLGVKLIGFKELFFISGLVSLIFSFVFLIFIKDKDPVNQPVKSNNNENNETLSYGKVLILTIILMCIPVTMREIMSWSFFEITPFWVKYGHSYGITIGIVQMMQYSPGLIVQPITGKLCDKFKPLRMVVFTFTLLGVGFILFAGSGPVVLWIALIVFGLGMSSSTVASETFMASIATSKNRSLIYGVVLSVGLAIGGLTAGVAGKVVDRFGKESVTGYRIWFIIIGIILIISTSMYFIIAKLRKKRV